MLTADKRAPDGTGGDFASAMIFVWAICSAGIAKSLPWPLDLAIRRERLAETKTNTGFRVSATCAAEGMTKDVVPKE